MIYARYLTRVAQAKLILPASLRKAFSLKVGDELKIRTGKKPDGTEFIMLKPARPTLRVRMKHFETESQLDVYRLTPEGDVDPNYAPVKKKDTALDAPQDRKRYGRGEYRRS